LIGKIIKILTKLAMEWLKDVLEYEPKGKGMTRINAGVEALVKKHAVHEGMCFLYIPHVSASLTISEGFDPSAREDVVNFYERLVPENQTWFEHTIEGPDDSPSHIRSTLTQTSLSIPIDNGCLTLGIWQGIFLFEHRTHPTEQKGMPRKIYVRFLKVN
jgi:secondary thiamine-phosphate synthase enzyme